MSLQLLNYLKAANKSKRSWEASTHQPWLHSSSFSFPKPSSGYLSATDVLTFSVFFSPFFFCRFIYIFCHMSDLRKIMVFQAFRCCLLSKRTAENREGKERKFPHKSNVTQLRACKQGAHVLCTGWRLLQGFLTFFCRPGDQWMSWILFEQQTKNYKLNIKVQGLKSWRSLPKVSHTQMYHFQQHVGTILIQGPRGNNYEEKKYFPFSIKNV